MVSKAYSPTIWTESGREIIDNDVPEKAYPSIEMTEDPRETLFSIEQL
jgi:hypothetical protein